MGAGPGGKDLLGKNHKAASISWTGRAERLNPVLGSIPCRGDPAGRPRARRILRKPVQDSKKRAHRADAFCPEAPCPRATTQASRIFKLWMAAAKERIYPSEIKLEVVKG